MKHTRLITSTPAAANGDDTAKLEFMVQMVDTIIEVSMRRVKGHSTL